MHDEDYSTILKALLNVIIARKLQRRLFKRLLDNMKIRLMKFAKAAICDRIIACLLDLQMQAQ